MFKVILDLAARRLKLKSYDNISIIWAVFVGALEGSGSGH
jgi:hypothetical protein